MRPNSIHTFVNYFNTQLSRLNSRFLNLGLEAVDADTCNWGGENNWWCPPIYLIPRMLGHAKEMHAKGTLILPQWSFAPFWSMLFITDSKVKQNVVATEGIEREKVVIWYGRSEDQLFARKPNTNLPAVRLDCQ